MLRAQMPGRGSAAAVSGGTTQYITQILWNVNRGRKKPVKSTVKIYKQGGI